MLRVMEAIYENGTLRPLAKLHLAEKEKIKIVIFSEQDYLAEIIHKSFLRHQSVASPEEAEEACQEISLIIKEIQGKLPYKSAQEAISKVRGRTIDLD